MKKIGAGSLLLNVFVKPNEQNEVYFNYAMARKRQFIEPLSYERPMRTRPHLTIFYTMSLDMIFLYTFVIERTIKIYQ